MKKKRYKRQKKNKGFFGKLKWLQSKLDLTPLFIKLSNKVAKKNKLNIWLFFLFLIVGFFGIFLPLVQGWLVIGLAFTCLGIKPVNKFIQKNKKGIENFGAFIFFVSLTVFFVNAGLWGVGLVEASPLDNFMGTIQYGKEQFNSIHKNTFSVIGVDYADLQQSLSLVNYDDQGFSVIGIER